MIEMVVHAKPTRHGHQLHFIMLLFIIIFIVALVLRIFI